MAILGRNLSVSLEATDTTGRSFASIAMATSYTDKTFSVD